MSPRPSSFRSASEQHLAYLVSEAISHMASLRAACQWQSEVDVAGHQVLHCGGAATIGHERELRPGSILKERSDRESDQPSSHQLADADRPSKRNPPVR